MLIVNKEYWIIIIYLILIPAGFSQTDISGGDVSGTWTLINSPYRINGEITIPKDSTLTIEPGVEIVFMGHYKFNVQGRLLALGTKKDSISFTAEDALTGWHGIRFNRTPETNDSSKIIYCSFINGNANTGSGLDMRGGAIMISRFNKVLISDCLFDSNTTNGDPTISGGAAIYIELASPIIIHNTFSHHTGISDGAIQCNFTSKAIISYNVFSNNKGRYGSILCGNSYDNKPIISGNVFYGNVATTGGGGIFAMYSKALITNNLFFRNYSGEGGGIKFYYNDKSLCINNTIAYNSSDYGGGIAFRDNSDPIFINNIIYGNSGSYGNVCILESQSDPHFFFCDIQGGEEEFKGSGAGVNYTGLYKNNIDTDPLFNDTATADYSLSISSPCIGTGIDSLEVAGFWYYAPPFCIMGKPRPSPVGTRPDIGACENLLGFPTGVEDELINPIDFVLYQSYPNPFNPSTSIQYAVSSRQFVVLKVYDILGNEVATLVNEEKPAGTYEVTWNAGNLSSGVYFYTLKAGGFTATKKLLLLK